MCSQQKVVKKCLFLHAYLTICLCQHVTTSESLQFHPVWYWEFLFKLQFWKVDINSHFTHVSFLASKPNSQHIYQSKKFFQQNFFYLLIFIYLFVNNMRYISHQHTFSLSLKLFQIIKQNGENMPVLLHIRHILPNPNHILHSPFLPDEWYNKTKNIILYILTFTLLGGGGP
jgi:hypothetical protein